MDLWTAKVQELSDDMLLLIRHALQTPRTYFIARTDDERFQILKLVNDDGCRLHADTNMPVDDSYCGLLYRSKEDLLVVQNAHEDARVASMQITDDANIGSYLGVRIELSDGKTFGTLCALDPNPQGFHDAQIACISAAARILSNAIDAEILAYRDTLSGLFNRAYLKEIVRLRANEDVTLLLFDFDDFKKINDQFGHESGDVFIQTFGDALKQTFPREEHIRLGGDEFCVILSEMQNTELRMRVQQLRDMLKRIPIHATTFSCGVVKGSLNQVSMLLTSADKALYEAKYSGKDQVVFV